LSILIFSKEVQVTDKGLDRYGRTIGITIMSDTNVNELMLKRGYAWHYKQYDHNSLWNAYEKDARKLRKGLWVDENPIEPWNWRHSSRENNYSKRLLDDNSH
jgi:micrococcal nuclease